MVYRYALSFKRIFEDYVYFYKKVTREKLDSQIWGTMSRGTVIMVVVTPHPNTMSLRWDLAHIWAILICLLNCCPSRSHNNCSCRKLQITIFVIQRRTALPKLPQLRSLFKSSKLVCSILYHRSYIFLVILQLYCLSVKTRGYFWSIRLDHLMMTPMHRSVFG